MNIVLLGHQDTASLYALDNLVRQCPGHRYRVFWSPAVTKERTDSPILDSLEAADRRMFLDYLARPATSPLFREAAILDAPNRDEGLSRLEAAQPDVLISIRYRRILREDAIAIPTHGVLNLHSGILPDYRGVMATFWAMLASEREIGTSLHRIVDAGIDTGPVIAIRRQPVDYDRSYLDNVLRLYPDGCRSIVEALAELEAQGNIEAAEQPRGEGRYYGPPSEADARAFLDRGLLLAPQVGRGCATDPAL